MSEPKSSPAIGPADVAIITGGASGIGLALGRALASRGAAVLLADVEGAKAEAAAAAIRDEGGSALGCFVDVTDPASNQALADFAFERFGRVTLVFLNAGVGAAGPVHKGSRTNIEWTFAVNVMGTIDGVRAFAPKLLEQTAASRIVITASEHGLGLPPRGGQVSAYTASKHALVGLASAMRRDYADTQLDVSVLCPGLVVSEIWNAFRNRQPQFGGARQIDASFGASNAAGLPSNIAAERIIRGIEAGEFFLYTHGRDILEVSQPRAEEVAASLARFAEREGPDA